MNTLVQEIHPVVTAEYTTEYLGWAIGVGLIWAVASQVPYNVFRFWVFPGAWIPEVVYLANQWNKVTDGLSMWTRVAWESMAYGSEAIFGSMTLMWLLAFIPNKDIAKAYQWTMDIGILLSWGLCLWVITAFILGGVITDGVADEIATDDDIGFNVMYGLIYTALVIGFEALAEYALQPNAIKYYDL